MCAALVCHVCVCVCCVWLILFSALIVPPLTHTQALDEDGRGPQDGEHPRGNSTCVCFVHERDGETSEKARMCQTTVLCFDKRTETVWWGIGRRKGGHTVLETRLLAGYMR